MKIIKETSRKIGKITKYEGVCDACGTPLEYDDELIVVEIYNTEKVVLVPIDCLVCPSCNKELVTITMWKNMDISQELMELKS